MKLTEISCRNAKATDKPLKLYDGRGLFLLVQTSGAKYWRFKYRFGGKEKTLALGVYPQITLKQARDLTNEAKKKLEQNLDPMQEKKIAKFKAVVHSENTFEILAKEWHENWRADKSDKHAQAIMNRLERDVFPLLGSMPVKDITPPMVLQILRNIEKREAYDVARRLKQTCGQIFRFGVATGRADRDVTSDLKEAVRPYKPEHYPTLEIKEIPAFLEKLDKSASVTQQTRLAMKFLMLTFVRTSELIRAEWAEIDLKDKTWLIPAAKMKMRRDHLVPLSKQAIDILEELKPYSGHLQYVFPSMARPRDHMSNATLTRAIMRLGYKGKMSGHGFRALAMTAIKERLNYRHEVIDRQLAHAQDKITAAYDRALFLQERKVMMQEWADYIDGLMGGGEVIKAKFGS